MAEYLQYHNAEKLGWVPFGERPFLQTDLGIYTRRREVLAAVGARVYLIVRIGTPGAYYLWDAFTVERVEKEGDGYRAWGTGWQLVPPQRLQGPEFEQFHRACAYFIGFQQVDRLPYAKALAALAEAARGRPLDEAEAFCSHLVRWRPTSGDPYYFRGFVRATRGLHAEAADDFRDALRLGTEFAAQAEAALATQAPLTPPSAVLRGRG
jgi:hypothetical protein